MRKDNILRAAEKFLASREFGQAVAEYQKLLEIDPGDPAILDIIGDILVQDNQSSEALLYFRRVADIYLDRGFSLKAISVLGKILRIDPGDLNSRQNLAELFERQGLFHEARRQLRLLGEHFEKSENVETRLAYLKRLSRVQPEDADLWRRQAHMNIGQGHRAEAMRCFVKAAERYVAQGDFEDALRVSFDALGVDNRQRDCLQACVEAAEQLGKLEIAEEFLQEQIERTGDEYPFRVFLAQVIERRGDKEAAGRLYHNLEVQGYQDPLISEGLTRTGWVDEEICLFEPHAETPEKAVRGNPRVFKHQSSSSVYQKEVQPEILPGQQPASEPPPAETLDLFLEDEPGDSTSLVPVKANVDREPEKSLEEFAAEVENALGSLFVAGPEEVSTEETLGYNVASQMPETNRNPETHYDLGLAYREMGLTEDAVSEFLKAAELAHQEELLPQRILCCSVLAASYNEIGEPDLAIRWSEEGLAIPGVKSAEWKALKLNLANGLEKKKEMSKARKIYQEILLNDPEYRDVKERLARLEDRGEND